MMPMFMQILQFDVNVDMLKLLMLSCRLDNLASPRQLDIQWLFLLKLLNNILM
jgi:hypothetical protein